MAIPHTLPGTIGLILFVTFVGGMILEGTNPGSHPYSLDVIQNYRNIQQSTGDLFNSTNPINALYSTGSVLTNSLNLGFGTATSFEAILNSLPEEFAILSIIIVVFFIVSIWKFIRGNWDY